jgi:transposase-like protein
VWLDALYVKVRQNHRIVSQAVVIAIGVREAGEVLGFAVGASEEHAFGMDFLRRLVARGRRRVQLVISDAHEGLKTALAAVLSGASWQRCRVHCRRNILAHVPQGD